MELQGTPSDRLPGVAATGATSARYAFMSLSARHPQGCDADYIAWHSLDHRPEQYRLPGLRNAIRLVSTPEARALRAASVGGHDSVDHVMTYMFTEAGDIAGFKMLGDELGAAGRMPIRLPSLGYMTADLAGMIAADHAVIGRDVLPWRPFQGVYLLIEEGAGSPAGLIDVPGVAGIWWYQGNRAPAQFSGDATGRQISFCFLDSDPLAVASAMTERLERRWRQDGGRASLAAPFYPVIPWEWERYLP